MFCPGQKNFVWDKKNFVRDKNILSGTKYFGHQLKVHFYSWEFNLGHVQNFLSGTKIFCPGQNFFCPRQIFFVPDKIFFVQDKIFLSRTKHFLSMQKDGALISHLAQINNFEVMGLKPFELLHRKPPSTSITAVHLTKLKVITSFAFNFTLLDEYKWW